jgi:hypothetical protein
MVLRLLVLIGLAAGLLAVAGCGGSSDSSTAASETVTTSGGATVDEEAEEDEDTEEKATPEEALAEIQAIGPLIDDAVAQYAAGEQEAAAEAVGDIYLDHFEQVEGPLGDVNHDLMEDLEELISTDLRNAMQEGKPVEDVEAIAAEIQTKLDQAAEELQ